MIKIGLTGGIGTGKSTVAKLFENLGIPVYYADDRAKYIMQHDSNIKKQIKNLFGEAAYNANGLNTKYIGGIVFENPRMLKSLEQIVHPAVRADFLKWLKHQNSDYIIVENAILHKTGMDELVDYIITVTADMDKRLQRLLKRDKKSKKAIQKVMMNQDDEEKLLKTSDFIIENSGDLDKLKQKIIKIDKKVKEKLKKS